MGQFPDTEKSSDETQESSDEIQESLDTEESSDEIQSLDNEQTSDKMKQSPCELNKYLVGPSLSMESLNNCEGHYPGAFSCIPKEVFLLIIDYLNYLDIRELEQVCRPFFVTIWLERPLIQGSFIFWLPKEIKYSWNKYSYELCMELDKKRAIYKDNTSMDPVCYFGGIMNQSPPQFWEDNSLQWNIITLEGQTDDDFINQSWVNYLGECINLHFLGLDNINEIKLDHIRNLTKLEVLFMKFKPVNILEALIDPPSSVKAIVVSISEESDRNIQFSKGWIAGVSLKALEGTRLDIW
jgi:hypothetical protein